MSPEQKGKWVEQIMEGEKISTIVVEFPYRFLKTYLTERGLDHLSKIVPWTSSTAATRSKTFINLLKIRIQFFYPDKMGDILKNEGHVRLMSSIWHLFRYLKVLVISCIIMISLVIFNELYQKNNAANVSNIQLLNLIYLGFLLLFSTLGKMIIETFFHYQRVREVFYVLETAYTTSITNGDILSIDEP
jgi:multisubunit Na+/H+ antiporter MnhG subunit